MDLIIGCSTNYDWNKLKFWINSINQSGFQGDKVLILMNTDSETVKKVVESGFYVIAIGKQENGNIIYNSKLPVHVERFFHIHRFLRDNDYRYVITTDVKDVVFQKNPIEFIQNNLSSNQQLIFSSESLLYKDEPWGNNNLLQTYGQTIYEYFKNNEIFNVGVLGGRGFAMRDLTLNIFSSCLNKPIPICDQSTFNFLISQEPYKSINKYCKSEDGWAAQLGTTADPSKINSFRPHLLENEPKMIDGKVTTSTGKVFTIAHQYDRVPEWKRIIESEYA